MARKYYKPTSPGIRHRVRLTWDTEGGDLTVPKHLRSSKHQSGGRNNRGRITSYHRGGGNKRFLRTISTPRSLYALDGTSLPYAHGTVLGIQYDPGRTARIALIQPLPVQNLLLPNGELKSFTLAPSSTLPFYQIATKSLSVGNTVTWIMDYLASREIIISLPTVSNGSTLFLRDIPRGQSVCDIELAPYGGGKRARSSGTHAVVQDKTDDHATLRLPSGEVRRIPSRCRAVLGSIGGEDHALEVIGKAGLNRHRSKRPKVRGCAMNPIDHPHGGRTAGGRPTMTPWARVAKGKPTSKHRSVFVVLSSRASKAKNARSKS